MNNIIETVSGCLVDLDNPLSHSISIDDIGWVLSRTGRMNGHTITEIQPNNADHSILVAEILHQHIIKYTEGTLCEPHNILFRQYLSDIDSDQIKKFGNGSYKEYELLIKALMHDAAEYITGDIPSPVKRITGIKDLLSDLESKIESCICSKLHMGNFSSIEKMLIKVADMHAQYIEHFNFLRSRGSNFDWNYQFEIDGREYIIPIRLSILDLSVFREPRLAKESYIHFMDYFNGLHSKYMEYRENTASSKQQTFLLNAIDNLNDLPISETWASSWVNEVSKTFNLK